jgi:hypothetical protein
MMRNKKIVVLFFFFTCNCLYSQLLGVYDVSNNETENEKVVLINKINSLFVNFKNKFKEHVKSEFENTNEVFISIENKKDILPPLKYNFYKINTLSDLEYKLSDREIELDFEYLLMYDEINSLLSNYGYDTSFFPDAKVEGRVKGTILKKIKNIAQEAEEVKKQIGLIENGSGAVDAAALLVTINPAILAAAGFVEISSLAINLYIDHITDIKTEFYTEGYIDGKFDDDRLDVIEYIKINE